ncbi:MAG: cyanophycinase [Bacteroidia bacterium]
MEEKQSMKVPNGKLIIIGGSEHKGKRNETSDKEAINPDFMQQEILKRLIQERGRGNGRIEVIPTASTIPDEIGNEYMAAFRKLDCDYGDVLNIKTREDAYKKTYLDRIKKADAVMFSGGDQLRLSTILGGTPVLDLIIEKYWNEDFLIAGTSAGAMVMSNSMIFSGQGDEALFKGELKITSGFGLIPGIIIDTHFIKRGRFGRLAQAVAINPGYIGLGLEEDTAVYVSRGTKMEAIGSGNVLIIDGHEIRQSNITSIDEGSPISIEGLIVHVLARGDLFSLTNRHFVSKDENMENIAKEEEELEKAKGHVKKKAKAKKRQ